MENRCAIFVSVRALPWIQAVESTCFAQLEPVKCAHENCLAFLNRHTYTLYSELFAGFWSLNKLPSFVCATNAGIRVRAWANRPPSEQTFRVTISPVSNSVLSPAACNDAIRLASFSQLGPQRPHKITTRQRPPPCDLCNIERAGVRITVQVLRFFRRVQSCRSADWKSQIFDSIN